MQHLTTESHQRKHQNNSLNLFKFNEKILQRLRFRVFIVNFEENRHIVLVFPLLNLLLNVNLLEMSCSYDI